MDNHSDFNRRSTAMETRLKKEARDSRDESKYIIYYSQGETLWETLCVYKNSKPNRDQYTNLDLTEETYQTKQNNWSRICNSCAYLSRPKTTHLNHCSLYSNVRNYEYVYKKSIKIWVYSCMSHNLRRYLEKRKNPCDWWAGDDWSLSTYT